MKKKFTCRRCGECCLSIPCVFAQIKYGMTIKSETSCPKLLLDAEGIYSCALIAEDKEAYDTLVFGGCSHPDRDKSHFYPRKVVREFFPKASTKKIEYILWEQTSFPSFWHIGVDGWSPLQCLRKELSNLKESMKG